MQAACSSDAYSSRHSTPPTTRARTCPQALVGLGQGDYAADSLAETTGAGTSARASRSAARCKSVRRRAICANGERTVFLWPERPKVRIGRSVRRLGPVPRGRGALRACQKNPAANVRRRTAPPGGRARWPSQLEQRLSGRHVPIVTGSGVRI